MYEMDDMSDMLEDLNLSLQGLLLKKFSKRTVLLHEAKEYDKDSQFSSSSSSSSSPSPSPSSSSSS